MPIHIVHQLSKQCHSILTFPSPSLSLPLLLGLDLPFGRCNKSDFQIKSLRAVLGNAFPHVQAPKKKQKPKNQNETKNQK